MKQKDRIALYLSRAWYQAQMSWVLKALIPCSWIFVAIVWLRKRLYQIVKPKPLSKPVIVVGNLTVGATGKTPLVIALAKQLKALGYTPGVVLLGYGGCSKQYPLRVTPDSDVKKVGDEALVIARETNFPVAIAPNRKNAALLLIQSSNCDVIISDDGLQHYSLPHDIEIAIVDINRAFGNGWLLPAGPLREPLSRLGEVSCIIMHHRFKEAFPPSFSGIPKHKPIFRMDLNPVGFFALQNQRRYPLHYFKEKTVHAVCGIGQPEQFFKTLQALKVTLIEHVFPDHYAFVEADLDFDDSLPIVMTHKDAVKCVRFENPRLFYLAVEALTDVALGKFLKDQLQPRRFCR